MSFTKTDEKKFVENNIVKTICTNNNTQLSKINVDNINDFNCSQSTFYLDKNGELNGHSLCFSDEKESNKSGRLSSLLTQKVNETQNIQKIVEIPKKKIINKARTSLKYLIYFCFKFILLSF